MMGEGAKVLVLQHVAGETAGLLRDVLEAEGLEISTTRIFEDQPVPADPREAIGLVVLGGPMGVYELDRYPYLGEEIRLIEKTLRRRVPVLGICLGSQLLAAALGAGVSRGRAREIGWHPVTLREEARDDRLWSGVDSPFTAFHWHGDIFGLPRGAVSLARSAATEHQAFRYGGRAYGLLFHPEVTPEIVAAMVADGREELRQEGINEQEILEGVRTHRSALESLGRIVLGRWAVMVREE